MANAASTGQPIVADTRQLSRLARDIRAASPAAWKACRVALRASGQTILDTAKANASYSSRIPGSGKVVVTAGGNIKVTFGGESAPDAAAIENKGKGFVRHPTFSPRPGVDEKVGWTSARSHPAFLGPALDAHREEIAAAIIAAVGDAVEHALKGGGL